MPTNLNVDERLIEKARKAGGHKTKKEAVSVALEEYIKRRKRQEAGASYWDPMYAGKAERRRKRA
jgi:Arc/MetJ family transcription regulator